MKKLICFIAVMMLTVITASAQELSAHITADEQTGAITVSGNGAAYGGQLVSILIARDEGGFYSPDSPLITEAVHSDENGGFSLTVFPANALLGGEYQAEISTADESLRKSFIVVSFDSADELFELAEKCKTKTELNSLLQTRPYDMGVSQNMWDTHSSGLTDAIYNGLDTCKTTADFIKLCRSALAMERILNGEDIAGVLQESVNSMYVGDETCYDMWSSLDDESKAKVTDNYVSGKDPALCFAESCLMSAVESAQSWRELSDVIYPSDDNIFADVLDLNTAYFTSRNADQIMRLVYKEINSMDTPEDIRSIFLKVSKNYEKEKDTSSGGSSGGSAGGGSPVVQSPASGGEIIFDYTESSGDVSFTDTKGHWGEGYITKLAVNGDVNGYSDGSFRPDNLVTRAEFATMLFNCFDIAASNVAEGFLDVSSSDWFAVGVNACKSAGIVNGDEFNCFNPDMYITREDAAVMLYRLICRMAELEEVPQIPFNDEALISDYAKSAVGALVDEGVISGFGNGYFKPQENTTRAQAAAMLVKSLDFLSAVS